MTKEEILALGVPEEKYREFQRIYSRDVNRAAKHERTVEGIDQETRAAIHAMLKLIKRPETLGKILKYVNTAYYNEV